MNDAVKTEYFVSYTGMSLPLNLVNPVTTTENRMTFFRAHYDTQDRIILCEKVVYGEIEFAHRYHYYPDGVLQTAEITDENGDVETLQFDTQGKRI
ncbi:DUF6156 family protein [Beggiatoa leptomitoformis]|uniref:RHS repeat protein n=1 Tax=Beggiatoa leptomitoformis TaxID=288004 RepID=A0A2N9YEJ2_9GAMM|nr:DUF6156 family protein [Beggiatoa leptomitoformis]ALG68821.1 hypothetical protein AL038_15350 [Beggiatoa leptomitoformis]AUI68815.1 hypothetical protein BLE401_08910 [Beggiatoa leptomitoformis]